MTSDRSRVMWEGLWAGLAGYFTIAIILAIGNALAGHSPFYTPALLGSALFYGVRDVADVRVWPGPVLAYNGFHLLLMLALGTIAAWLARVAERGPHLWYAGVLFYLLVSFHVFAIALAFAAPPLDAMMGWTMIAGGMLASLAMALLLLGLHPRLRAEIRDFAAQDRDLLDVPR